MSTEYFVKKQFIAKGKIQKLGSSYMPANPDELDNLVGRGLIAPAGSVPIEPPKKVDAPKKEEAPPVPEEKIELQEGAHIVELKLLPRKTIDNLAAVGISTVSDLCEATDEELLGVAGIGENLLKKLRAACTPQ